MTAPLTPSNTDATSGNGSPSPAPTGSSPAEPQVWRAGEGADPRLRGKSADEILGIAGALLTVAERFNQPIPQVQVQAPAPNRFDVDIPDEEYIQGKDVKRIMQQFQGPQNDPVARQQALALTVDRLRERYKKDFEKWGGEIYQMWNSIHPDHITLDTLESCVKMVRSNHVSEIAAEMAQQLAGDTHQTIRSGTGGSGSGPLTQQKTVQSESLPAEWRSKAQSLGITDATVREWCQMTGESPEQYLATVEKYGTNGAVIRG